MDKSLAYSLPGKYLNLGQKQMAEILRTTNVTWGFESSEGVRPNDVIVPHKATPVARVIKDQSYMRRPIVIPIGTVVSAMPVLSQAFYQSTASATLSGTAPVPVSGESVVSGLDAGEVALGTGYDASMLVAPIDDQVEAYGRVNLAAIIANGGVNVQDPYHAYDIADAAGAYSDETARVDEAGNTVTASSLFHRRANMPIGVVTDDIFLDDTGKFLNFTTSKFQKFDSFLTDWYVEVPYVVTGMSLFGTVPTGGDWYSQTAAAYKAIVAMGMPVMFVDTIASLQNSIGAWVKPNINGKYQLDVTNGTPASAKTVQHVGRLTAVDNKFPKDLEDLVMMVQDTGVGGTDTYGLPFRLFKLAYSILQNLTTPVTSPTYEQIVNVVNSGYVGVAKINLHVS